MNWLRIPLAGVLGYSVATYAVTGGRGWIVTAVVALFLRVVLVVD